MPCKRKGKKRVRRIANSVFFATGLLVGRPAYFAKYFFPAYPSLKAVGGAEAAEASLPFRLPVAELFN